MMKLPNMDLFSPNPSIFMYVRLSYVVHLQKWQNFHFVCRPPLISFLAIVLGRDKHGFARNSVGILPQPAGDAIPFLR